MVRAAFLVVLLILFGVVGNEGYEDELQRAENYCEMVNNGAWPNYEQRDCP